MQMTAAQEKSLLELYQRDLDTVASNCQHEIATQTVLPIELKTPFWKDFDECRRKAVLAGDIVAIFWRNIWLGIEPDGYRHS